MSSNSNRNSELQRQASVYSRSRLHHHSPKAWAAWPWSRRSLQRFLAAWRRRLSFLWKLRWQPRHGYAESLWRDRICLLRSLSREKVDLHLAIEHWSLWCVERCIWKRDLSAHLKPHSWHMFVWVARGPFKGKIVSFDMWLASVAKNVGIVARL